jgi:hypothetical protein
VRKISGFAFYIVGVKGVNKKHASLCSQHFSAGYNGLGTAAVNVKYFEIFVTVQRNDIRRVGILDFATIGCNGNLLPVFYVRVIVSNHISNIPMEP